MATRFFAPINSLVLAHRTHGLTTEAAVELHAHTPFIVEEEPCTARVALVERRRPVVAIRANYFGIAFITATCRGEEDGVAVSLTRKLIAIDAVQ